MKKSPTKKKRAKKPTKGKELFQHVVRLTGIPSQTIQKELKSILEKKNIDIHHLTVEQLRSVAASYVREIMGGILDRYNRRSDHQH